MKRISNTKAYASFTTLILVSLVFFSIQTVQAGDPPENAWYPNVVIPSEAVNMTVTDGLDSYFEIELKNVSQGYDVQDGTYKGWCFEKSVEMTRDTDHQIKLVHSYDPDMPDVFLNGNWDMINYIINHKEGYDKDTIQDAIWWFIEGIDPSSSGAPALIEKAEQEGSLYCPSQGDLLAVLIYLDPGVEPYPWPVQNTFIEVPVEYEGCPPCFWRINYDDWIPTGISPDDLLSDHFDVPPPFDEVTFEEILSGSFYISCTCYYPPFYCTYVAWLLEEAAAGLLNINHPDINYPLLEGQLIVSVNDAMFSGFHTIRLWIWLNMYNELGDPLCTCCNPC